MYYSAVLCCLLLPLVQATGEVVKIIIVICLLDNGITVTTCAQQGTKDCDQVLLTAACNIQREANKQVPLSCPPPVSAITQPISYYVVFTSK